MSIEVTYFGHSGFLFSGAGVSVAIDPFLTGNPLATHKPGDVKCQHICVTHGHSDHVGDAVAIAKGNNATVYGAFEVCNFLGEQGVAKCEAMNPGGKVKTDFGFVALTQAFHSSSYDGRYMGMPCGVILNISGVTIYHCGDTALFGDMKLIGEMYKPDIACIPIGDRFTMGPELAARAAEFIKPRVAIPVHYNTWPPIAQDPAKFKPSGVEVKVMRPGEIWTFE